MEEHDGVERFAFIPGAVDPDTDAFNRAIEAALAEAPPLYKFDPPVIRAARAAGQSVFGPIKRLDEARDDSIPGPAGRVPVRIFLPDAIRGVYLHFHGGGFMLGTVDQHDEFLAELSRHCRLAVVTVGYRLAPENPYPAAPDDCEAAACWLAENAAAEFGTDRLMVGGESAGANLAAVTLLRMRDRHQFTGFHGAVLSYGAFDLGLTPSARRWGERYLILTTEILAWFNRNYAGAELHADPDVSPLYADLRGMPPALFVVGTLDPLLDDSLFMHARWLAAGNRASLGVFPGGIHAFNFFPFPLARRGNQRIAAFIDSILA